MLKFSEFLVEAARGDITASQGHANEFFANDHGNLYAQASQDALRRGASREDAHKAGIQAINSKEYDHDFYSEGKNTKKAIGVLGKDNAKMIHDNSRNTAAALAEYIYRRFNGRLSGSMWVGAGQAKKAQEASGGKKTNGDLLLRTEHGSGENKEAEAYLENDKFTGFGGSLKYSSTDKDTQTKIHSPGITTLADMIDNHHKQMFGKSSGIHDALDKARKEGQEAQRKVATSFNSKGVSHHEVLKNYLEQLRNDPEKYRPKNVKSDDWSKLVKNAKYLPTTDKKGNVEGADVNEHFLSLIRKTVRNKTSGVDHKALDEYYSDLSNANSGMKNKIADAIHSNIEKILSHKSSNPQDQEKHNAIKESLHRSIANVHSLESNSDQLPTLLVKTGGDGSVNISDSNESFRKHLENEQNLFFTKKSENKGSFRVGPGTLTIDSRPGTMHNPLINPANYTVPSTFLRSHTIKYKNGKFDTPIESPPSKSGKPAQTQSENSRGNGWPEHMHQAHKDTTYMGHQDI